MRWAAHGYVPLEAEATRVRDYTLGFVPGLLQTAGYAREIFLTSPLRRTETELTNAVTVRMIRQHRLTAAENPLEVVALIDEAVVLRPVGGAAVMRTQLAHLVAAAALPTVSLQVLPLSLGARRGLSAGFTLLSFADMPDLAYLEHPMGAVHMEKEADVATATLTFDQLRSLALNPEDSVTLIRRAAERL